MARFGTRLRGVGAVCLLAVICLCQSVLAHNDGRANHGDWWFKGQRIVHKYQLVRVQRVAPDLNEYTYRAFLTNFGAPLAGAQAAITSHGRKTEVVDGTVTFGAVAKGRTVMSRDTFSVRHHRRHPFHFFWPELRWAVTPIDGTSTNHAPLANAGPDRAATQGARVTLNGGASSDPDRDPLRYAWTLTRPAGSSATLSSPTSATPSFVPDRRGTFEARLVVDDGVLSSAPDSVTITVSNTAPAAHAGADQMARVATVVTLDGSASSDPDGDGVSYLWTVVSRPSGSSAVLSDPAAVAPTFLVDRAGSYTLQLVVSDGAASSAADTVTITTLNTAPAANAGPDQTAPVGTTVSLNGSGSSDADGNALTYAWTVQSRPAGSAATVGNAHSVTPSMVVDRAGTYVVRLIVNDGQAASAADTVTISTANSAPVANAGADRTALVEQTVTLNGGGSSDVDGDALTFSWAFVSRPAGSSAALSNTTAVQPTFVVDRAGAYRVRLIVHDGVLSSVADVVDVQTLNSPPVAHAGPDQSAFVSQTVTLDGSGSTDVDGNVLSYVWSLTNRPPGSRAAVSDPGAVLPAFTVDRAGIYVAQLIVNDGVVSSAPDTVTVTTRNSAPVANAGPDVSTIARRVVPLAADASTDVDGDPLTFSWALIQRPTGSAAALASLTNAFTSFTADRPGTYIAQVIVNDGVLDSAPDTVTITTGNTTPVANAGADQVGLAVGGPGALDGSASTDADGHTLTYRWSLLSVPAGSAATLSDAMAASPWIGLDRGGQYVAQLIVNDGFQDSAPDTVVLQAANRPPIADAGTDQTVFTGDVAMLTGAGSSDPDGDAITYQWSLTSVPAGSTAVLSGAASVAPSFTANVAGTYVASLTVTDPGGVTATDSVTVTAFTPVTVSVATADANAGEAGPNTGSFTFTRTGSTAAPVTVFYTVGGSATAGADYAALSGSVVIAAGQAAVTIVLTPIDDAAGEVDETVVVTLAASAAYAVGAANAATVTIVDNEGPVVTIVATDANASEAGSDTGTFTISRTGPTTAALRVSLSASGSALSGADYAALGNNIFIPAGQVSVTLTVTPIADGVSEGAETIDMFLIPNAGTTIGTPASAQVVIAAN
jgi:hypothetical protein